METKYYNYVTQERNNRTISIITNISLAGMEQLLKDGFLYVDPVTWQPIIDRKFTNEELRELFESGEIDFIKEEVKL